MLTLLPLPAFNDNYIWLLHDAQYAWVVDPGDAIEVQRYLKQTNLRLQGVLLTHHHGDHTGGVDALRASTGAEVYGPYHEPLPEPVRRVKEGDRISVLGLEFEVIEVPGHTAGHIAYFSSECPRNPLLFSGDTLFSAGCGRLFEGTPEQMLASLDKLARLPPHTQVCCAHEYTLNNLRFALAVEPINQDILSYAEHCERLRVEGIPTLPARLGTELLVNPFLRTRQHSVRAAVIDRAPGTDGDVGIFAALRKWKDEF
ncbi:hydroxyacylglutathione hydrolase [Cupriavidus consociatus]|uniref:hydroxyacylglutathione hydrolase n=1 Tax=Cupriavidus consociatus TaxID=2821357 RepID=UPI001AE11278|nr:MULTISPECIES: hydroxyacylglutathione hydrolase [unclassified Cupriavidus]MBP0621183.1 hydroxyacylglutathione hydrolase [Cupriavidus sp. LEh25]MDK2657854.1 hydroxyacylglutathione hydrolase [Cupriavidus sp. LEh21]